jgi:hypothetical protein
LHDGGGAVQERDDLGAAWLLVGDRGRNRPEQVVQAGAWVPVSEDLAALNKMGARH